MDPPCSTSHCGAAIRISGTEEDNLTSTETQNNSFLILRNCRDGGVHLFSAIGQTGHSSTGRRIQRDIFLDETTRESLDPSSLLDSKSLPHLCKARQSNQPDKLLLCSKEDEIQTDQTQGPTNAVERTQQTGHKGLSLDQNLAWTTEIVRIEDRGKRQRDSWILPESARSCQKARITGAGGIWDNKLD
ncbi:hypothetical protein FQN60_008976 [Etheostoma spectabile]|uniref:Uncharacterized protein n=1 Tax=Etheostoma spectabile TaxID=54343 RepID=A0A5J5CNN0_9PERO|nr:hypothetical protein FQN60_008976 [Etheostoma spectabile]